MSARPALCALALTALFTRTSCGGGPPRILESITVNAVSSLSGTTYTATGHFSAAPITVNNLAVAWYQTGPVLDPGPKYLTYTLTTARFKGICPGGPVQSYVVAYAPADPNAPATGSILFTDFVTLVEDHTVTQLDGFVAGSLAESCSTAQLWTAGPLTAAGF